MMGFVDHDPMWPAAARPQLLESRQQLLEERRPIGDSYAQQAYDRVLVGFLQQIHDCVDAGLALGVAEGHSARERLVVALRVDDAELVALFSQALQDRGREGRLAGAGRS